MNVLDSCVWLEFLGDGPNAQDYASLFKEGKNTGLLLPSICLQEVFRLTLARRNREVAETVAAFMKGQAQVVPHDAEMALEAALAGKELGLALADSIVYATARRMKATLWTQDAAFKELPGVHFVKKR